jgi:hypothetical protein
MQVFKLHFVVSPPVERHRNNTVVNILCMGTFAYIKRETDHEAHPAHAKNWRKSTIFASNALPPMPTPNIWNCAFFGHREDPNVITGGRTKIKGMNFCLEEE